MNRKKLFHAAVALTLALLTLFALSACSKQEEPASSAKPEDPSAAPAVTDVPAVTEEPATEVPPTEAPTEKPTKAPPASGTNVALSADVEVSSTTGDTHVQWGWSYEYMRLH